MSARTPVADITKRQFDFVIVNHTLEHVANPIRVIENVWGAIKEGGLFVLSVPDKDYTFDRARPLTTYEHLLADYFRRETVPNDDHYVDYLAHVHPEAFVDRDTFMSALELTRNRREHVHVWDSVTFRKHLVNIMRFLNIRASIVFEADGGQNQCEYFAILRKGSGKQSLALRIAQALRRCSQLLRRRIPRLMPASLTHRLRPPQAPGPSFGSTRAV